MTLEEKYEKAAALIGRPVEYLKRIDEDGPCCESGLRICECILEDCCWLVGCRFVEKWWEKKEQIMDIKSDTRHYYLKGLLRQLKTSAFDIEQDKICHCFSQRYRLPGWTQDEVKLSTQNGVIEIAIDYITELEAEVEKLQYVAKIIEAAKRC